MQLILAAEECELFLLEELRRAHPAGGHERRDGRWIASDLPLQSGAAPSLVFARQLLVEPVEHTAPSVSAWSALLLEAILLQVPESQPWRMHVAPCYGSGTAGLHRCQLILASVRDVLKRKHRRRLRELREDNTPFTNADSLVQVVLTATDRGLLSVATAPMPFVLRRVVSPFSLGEIPVASDKAAPSRAFAKLVEAEQRLGRRIEPGETCVDLGASPGSWTCVALDRGSRVTAVDRSPLREDLMRHARLHFARGDAFAFTPDKPMDWLLCDVIAAPERSIALLLAWLRAKLARCFVVTIKFKGHADYALLDELKHALPEYCDEWFLTRLCANKNEVCVFGIAAGNRS